MPATNTARAGLQLETNRDLRAWDELDAFVEQRSEGQWIDLWDMRKEVLAEDLPDLEPTWAGWVRPRSTVTNHALG
ncbi:MAG TPA: hypothetical protein PKE00_01645 [Planctomycetota bacterium]|nr:hypothetical protein [Planctomycetota bacterium]